MEAGRCQAPAEAPIAPRFDITAALRDLCQVVVERTVELAHVDLARVAIGYVQVRRSGQHGIQATLTPLRFAQGSLVQRRRDRFWTIERMVNSQGAEFLYLLRFYLPRFLDLPFTEKLTTVFHELWHIGTEFDGDLRRHPGRCFAHSHSREQYDAEMLALAQRWLADGPPSECYAFLEHGFAQLRARYGAIVGLKIRPPRLLPISADEAARLETSLPGC